MNVVIKKNKNLTIVKFILLIFLFSADISKFMRIENISFYIVLLFSLILMLNDYLKKTNKNNYLRSEVAIYFSIFTISIFIIILSNEITNIIHGIKLLLVFFVVYPSIRSFYSKNELIYYLKYILLLNIILIFLGNIGFNLLSMQTGLNRGSNILNYAGSLYKVGLVISPYLLWDIFTKRKNIIANMVLLMFSAAIIIYDGSRTGLYGFFIIILIYILNGLRCFIRRMKFSYKACLVYMLAFTLILIISYTYNDKFMSMNAIIRGFNTINLLFTDGLNAFLMYGDSIRGQMIIDGIAKIKANGFFVGQGFLTTQTSNTVVHNAYIQVFADLGLLPFLSVVILVLKPIMIGLTKIKNDKSLISSITLISVYAFTLLLHPLSVQPTDWALYLIPTAIIFEKYKSNI